MVTILAGNLVLSPTATSYWGGNAKAVRDAADVGSSLLGQLARLQSFPTWLVPLAFLGIGLMSTWPKELNPGPPAKPHSAKMFPMLMMMGWMILLIALIWALASNGSVTTYWSNTIATTLNPAGAGSTLLVQLGVIEGMKPWLVVLRYAGMAFLFTDITVALTVVIRTLQHQEKGLRAFVKARSLIARYRITRSKPLSSSIPGLPLKREAGPYQKNGALLGNHFCIRSPAFFHRSLLEIYRT